MGHELRPDLVKILFVGTNRYDSQRDIMNDPRWRLLRTDGGSSGVVQIGIGAIFDFRIALGERDLRGRPREWKYVILPHALLTVPMRTILRHRHQEFEFEGATVKSRLP